MSDVQRANASTRTSMSTAMRQAGVLEWCWNLLEQAQALASLQSIRHGLRMSQATFTGKSVYNKSARVAQSVERKALNFVVVGSSPTSGEHASLASAGCRPTLFTLDMILFCFGGDMCYNQLSCCHIVVISSCSSSSLSLSASYVAPSSRDHMPSSS